MRVAIVGGGVIGLACAWALREAGCEPVVLEAADVGELAASTGNTGWVVPSLSTPLPAPGMLREGLRSALDPRGALVLRPSADPSWVRWLLGFRRSCSPARYRQGVSALVALNARTLDELDRWRDAGVAFDEERSGVLMVGRTAHGIEWFAGMHEELVALGHRGGLERLDPDAARALEPALASSVAAALHATVDRYVRPESLLDGLAASLGRGGGAELRTGTPVRAIARVRDRWAVSVPGDEIRADAVVLAAGTSAPALARPLGLRLPIVGAKGYSVTMRGEGTLPRVALYLGEAKIGTATYGDAMRIAGFFELPSASTDPDAARVAQLVDDARTYLVDWRPRPDEIGAAGWAGLRPVTPDGLPLLGGVPGMPGLVIAAGHAMLGMTLAPVTGALVAELLTTGRTPPVLAPLRPDRVV